MRGTNVGAIFTDYDGTIASTRAARPASKVPLRLARVLLLGLSALAFLGGLKRGFVVVCEDGLRVFVPEAYERALRIADRLTPRELFAE